MFWIILAALLVWNIVSFFITAADKRKAEKGSWRTPEKVFLISAWCFGGWGVLTAFYAMRHKTKHRSLLLGVWIPTILETLFLLWALLHFVIELF